MWEFKGCMFEIGLHTLVYRIPPNPLRYQCFLVGPEIIKGRHRSKGICIHHIVLNHHNQTYAVITYVHGLYLVHKYTKYYIALLVKYS